MIAAEKILPFSINHALTPVSLLQGCITSMNEYGRFSIGRHENVTRAASCLLKPEVGDTVLYSLDDSGKVYILHLLLRSHENAMDIAQIDLPGVKKLVIRGKNMGLMAEQEMDISSLGDIKLSACFGTLLINSKNLFKNISDNLIENIQYQISKVNQYALTVKQLLRLHGKQQIITADQDIKIDAERINMG